MIKLGCEKFLLGFVAAVLTFFIAGLLYLLCFEHVDNLGAYSIPSGDRPSHPICGCSRQLTPSGPLSAPQVERYKTNSCPTRTQSRQQTYETLQIFNCRCICSRWFA